MASFEIGINPYPKAYTVDRKPLIERLEHMLRGDLWLEQSRENETAVHFPQRNISMPSLPASYFVIIGPSGVGKTTAVLEAIHSLPRRDGAKGVVYFNVNSETSVISGFCQAIDFEMYFEDIERWNWKEVRKESARSKTSKSTLKWNIIQPVLLAAAEKFNKKHGFLPALVIDAANIIATRDSAFLGQLQDFAKLVADNNTMRFFFVSSDSTTLSLLRSRSSERASVFEVDDISDKQAVQYLVARGVSAVMASDAVSTITGGRFATLNEYLSLHIDFSNEAILSKKFRQISLVLMTLNVDCSNQVFGSLVSGQTVISSMFRKFGISQVVMQKLVVSNILLNLDEVIHFGSRFVQHFFSLWMRKSPNVLMYCDNSQGLDAAALPA
jgi:hypothetical protein